MILYLISIQYFIQKYFLHYEIHLILNHSIQQQKKRGGGGKFSMTVNNEQRGVEGHRIEKEHSSFA